MGAKRYIVAMDGQMIAGGACNTDDLAAAIHEAKLAMQGTLEAQLHFFEVYDEQTDQVLWSSDAP